jgi:hypothetical protein
MTTILNDFLKFRWFQVSSSGDHHPLKGEQFHWINLFKYAREVEMLIQELTGVVTDLVSASVIEAKTVPDYYPSPPTLRLGEVRELEALVDMLQDHKSIVEKSTSTEDRIGWSASGLTEYLESSMLVAQHAKEYETPHPGGDVYRMCVTPPHPEGTKYVHFIDIVDRQYVHRPLLPPILSTNDIPIGFVLESWSGVYTGTIMESGESGIILTSGVDLEEVVKTKILNDREVKITSHEVKGRITRVRTSFLAGNFIPPYSGRMYQMIEFRSEGAVANQASVPYGKTQQQVSFITIVIDVEYGEMLCELKYDASSGRFTKVTQEWRL